MKRILGVLLVLFVCFSAACRTKDTQELVKPTTIPAATTEPTKEPEPTETPAPTNTPKPTATPKPTDVPAIKDVFAEHNMKVGTCMSYHMITTKKK